MTHTPDIEIAVMTGYGQVRVGVHGLTQNLELSEIEEVVKVIEAEQEAEAERRLTHRPRVLQLLQALLLHTQHNDILTADAYGTRALAHRFERIVDLEPGSEEEARTNGLV